MRIDEFNFDLPAELIAQTPLAERAASRMLAVDRHAGSFADHVFSELPKFLRSGDVLVLNNTKVFPARLFGKSETGASIEIFLVREQTDGEWEVLARPARRLNVGKRIDFGSDLSCQVTAKNDEGRVFVRFETVRDFYEVLGEIGRTPLPPYIKREATTVDTDRERYQTVYAKERGAIAAPTAGLHFTPEIFDELRKMGVQAAEITLHVGYGTFEPVRAENLADHRVSAERYSISMETTEILDRAKAEGRRIIAVGTTSTRTLEDTLAKYSKFEPGDRSADLTITPGYKFKAIDGLLTNFHLPQSSLLVLTSTFGGHELIMNAYRHAVAAKYRFYSYGDCMFVY
jgi:S-adenosylmethionine:tRNA ribosyltransferase-isomerase